MIDPKLVPRRKERLGDLLYARIFDQIVTGALAEGDKLPSENELCRSFEVSRPTVRDALMRLHIDGLVTTRQGSGSFVRGRPSASPADASAVGELAGLLRCMEVRIGLEGQAAALAAERRTPGQMDSLSEALDALEAVLDSGLVPTAADSAFHRAVAAASGNVLIVEIIDSLRDTTHRAMGVASGSVRTGSKDSSRRVYDEHEAIADAIRRGDGEAAGLAMRHHLHRTRQRIVDSHRDR